MMQNYSGCLNTNVLHTLGSAYCAKHQKNIHGAREACVCFLVFKAAGKRGGLHLNKIVGVVTFEYGHLKPACSPRLHKPALGAQVTLYIHWPRTEKPS